MASITLIPSGYIGLSNMTINSSYPITRGYTNSSDSQYTRFDVTQSRAGVVYFTFDTSDIPSGATITDITGNFKARVSNTTRVSSTIAQLCTGTTTKGNNVTFASTTASVRSLSTGGASAWTISDLNDLRLKIGGTASSSSSSRRIDFYGADVTITYTTSNVAVTGVSLPSTASVEVGNTTQLTATISPSNATNQNVTWSSGNTAVATVASDGTITGVSAGTAVITVTTSDGGYTDTCTVTVVAGVTYDYKLATSMVVGKKYLIANGNNGSVYLLSNESGGSRQLVGIAATVSNNKITINSTTKAKTEFECIRYTNGNDNTITVESDSKYLYTDNSTGLRMNAPTTLDRFWHYQNNKFWQFKSTSSNGYTDTSSEYKYYLELNNSNNFTDNHVTTTSVQDSSLPAIYVFVEDDGSSQEEVIYRKINGTWVQCSKVYKKINGSWVEQDSSTWSTLFPSTNNYRLVQ